MELPANSQVIKSVQHNKCEPQVNTRVLRIKGNCVSNEIGRTFFKRKESINFLTFVIRLHTRSVWETICDKKGFELVQNTRVTPPPKMKTWPDWGTLDLGWSRGHPPPMTNVGAGVWRLIAVSPKNTVSFNIVWFYFAFCGLCQSSLTTMAKAKKLWSPTVL